MVILWFSIVHFLYIVPLRPPFKKGPKRRRGVNTNVWKINLPHLVRFCLSGGGDPSGGGTRGWQCGRWCCLGLSCVRRSCRWLASCICHGTEHNTWLQNQTATTAASDDTNPGRFGVKVLQPPSSLLIQTRGNQRPYILRFDPMWFYPFVGGYSKAKTTHDEMQKLRV